MADGFVLAVFLFANTAVGAAQPPSVPWKMLMAPVRVPVSMPPSEVTVTLPDAKPSAGGGVVNKGTTTGPSCPRPPAWMSAWVGVPMPRQETE